MLKKEIELTIIYEGKTIKVDKEVTLDPWPEGLLDQILNIHKLILAERCK
jgi:predicted ATPase